VKRPPERKALLAALVLLVAAAGALLARPATGFPEPGQGQTIGLKDPR
jgi:hypothetical protein